MTIWDILLQQIINGVSLGAMYALLALGFTMVYGIIELINFAHFNVFMVGSFVACGCCRPWAAGRATPLYGLPLIGVLLTALVVTMLITGVIGVAIERIALRPMRNVPGTAAMITTIGVSYILFNVILLGAGAHSKNYPNPLPSVHWGYRRGGAATARGAGVGRGLRPDAGPQFLRAPHQDGQGHAGDRPGSGGGEHDGGRRRPRGGHRLLSRIGARRRGRPDLRPLLQLHELHHRLHGGAAGVHRGGARRDRQHPGRHARRHPDRARSNRWAASSSAVRWTDVIIFSILVLVLVFRPAGMLGRAAPSRS